MNKLTDLDWILEHTPGKEKLKVTLRRDHVKGISLYSTREIKKGSVIAYYHMRIYSIARPGPFGVTYRFAAYTKRAQVSKHFVGNLFEGSLRTPRRNIPYWAYFANEPDCGHLANSFVDACVAENYRGRDRLRVGDEITYKLIASRKILPGEEIVWCYGDLYERDYPV